MPALFSGGRRDDQKPPVPGERSGCKSTVLAIFVVMLAIVSGTAYCAVEAARALL